MPHLLSIRNDRNRKAQINDRALKEYFSSTSSASFVGRMARKVGLKQRRLASQVHHNFNLCPLCRTVRTEYGVKTVSQ